MYKIPSDVLVHSENTLVRTKEMGILLLKLTDVPGSGGKPDSMMFFVVHMPLTPIINELNTAVAIHENNKAQYTGEQKAQKMKILALLPAAPFVLSL